MSSENITLNSAAGTIGAYLSNPSQEPVGGVVICQEIFGVNGHIRRVCDQYAAQGFAALAPGFFDHVEKGLELAYNSEGIERGRTIMQKLAGWDKSLQDLSAATNYLHSQLGLKFVGVVGYCWGGSLGWLGACRLPAGQIQAASSYYGSQVHSSRDEKPRCPVIFNFGEKDANITMDKLEDIRKSHPNLPLYTYPAGHGFNTDDKLEYDAASAKLAFERTLQLFRSQLK